MAEPQGWIKPVLIGVATALACGAAMGVARSVASDPRDEYRLGAVEVQVGKNTEAIGALQRDMGVVGNDLSWIKAALRDSGITPKSER